MGARATIRSRFAPALLAVALAHLASCAYPKLASAPVATPAFDRPETTQLGRRFAPALEGHGEPSGLYVLGSGLDAFAARIGLIEQAERAVDLQVYIFDDDATGRLVLGRLLAAAERGVRLRLLVDDLGTSGLDARFAALDAHPSVEVRLFNPFARGRWPGLARALDFVRRPRRLNHRMHNKLLAVDGAAGIVGGRNVGDEYFDASESVNFADLDLLAAGPVVRELGQGFDLYWNSEFAVPVSAWESMRAGPAELAELRTLLDEHRSEQQRSRYAERLRESDIVRAAAEGELPLVVAPVHAVADLPEKIVARGDDVQATLLTSRMKPLLSEANSELLIVSPYFVPRERGIDGLAKCAERGVRVRVLTNSLAATDVAAVHAGYAPCRRELAERGVELYELRPTSARLAEGYLCGLFGSSSASLHAKTFLIDRRIVFVGSLNLDPRSVALNTEQGLVVESAELAERLARTFEQATSPELSYRVAVERTDAGLRLSWHGAEEGRAVELCDEPGTSWLNRLGVCLLGMLPIQGQL
jgi:putative cardiolipin synthase